MKYRALFISDVHLGTRFSQAEMLVDFLKQNDAETIYLVGDIVDFWRLNRGVVWPQSHNDVFQEVLSKIRNGTRVVFIPGNHDDGLRRYCGQRFGDIEIELQTVHETKDGKRYLVLHGDEFDVVVKYAKWLAYVGDRAYAMALAFNRPLNFIRKKFGFGYWSMSGDLKLRVKQAVNFVGDFEKNLASEAVRREASGVICGHIHHAASRQMEGVHYLNCGDWVESCTAIGETEDGTFEMIRWLDTVGAKEKAALAKAKLKVA